MSQRSGTEPRRFSTGLVEFTGSPSPGSGANPSIEGGDNVLIGGFITGNRLGNVSALVRAIGPSLAGQVPSPLADPILELHDSNGSTVATNNDWQDSQGQEIQQTGLAPTDAHESAIVASLQVGSHTVIVRGVNGTGNGVVEVYNLP